MFIAVELGSIICKQIIRWQHLFRIKARLLWLAENVISPIKTQQATSGTSAATYKVMEPQSKVFDKLSYLFELRLKPLHMF